MKIEDLQKIIGTPKENRDILVKSLLLDYRLRCKACDTNYVTGADMERLTILRYGDATNPAELFCLFECSCGHGGGYTFKPNPFIMANVSHNAYGT